MIDRSLEPVNGDIIVTYVEGEFTIKFLDLTHKDEGYIELRLANKDFKSIRIEQDGRFEV